MTFNTEKRFSVFTTSVFSAYPSGAITITILEQNTKPGGLNRKIQGWGNRNQKIQGRGNHKIQERRNQARVKLGDSGMDKFEPEDSRA